VVFGYDLLCDLLETLNLVNIGSAVATRRNLVEPIQRHARIELEGWQALDFREASAHSGDAWRGMCSLRRVGLFISNPFCF
jgi:hypothetical protein